MAPPLLPSVRLVLCPGCAEHVRSQEPRCPHCGLEIPREHGSRAAAAVVMGLALAGCTGKPQPPAKQEPAPAPEVIESPEPAYGGPATPPPEVVPVEPAKAEGAAKPR